MTKVAINGLGRIGRCTLKILLDSPDLELAGVNDLVPLENLAYLLRHDTVYGRWQKEIETREDRLVIDGQEIPIYNEKQPEKLPWGDEGVEAVFECTGVFRTKDDLQKHLKAGAKHVILSAPPKSEGVPLVVFGANELNGFPELISCASCTTNCITPVMEVLDRRIGVEKSTMTTVHAYTSSQALVDGPAKKFRRGRAAAANFVPTTTGAAEATTECLPQLKNKFSGVAIRGPVACGSIADIVCITERETTADEVNDIFREEAGSERYNGILGIAEEPLVSSDIIQDPHASIVDLNETKVTGGNLLKVMSWYDNEWGYSAQMVRYATKALQQPARV